MSDADVIAGKENGLNQLGQVRVTEVHLNLNGISKDSGTKQVQDSNVAEKFTPISTSEVHQSLKCLVESFEHVLSTGNDKTSIQLSPDSKAQGQESNCIKPYDDIKMTNSNNIFEKSSDAATEQEREIAKLDPSLSNLKLDDFKENTTEIADKPTEVESLQENIKLKQQVQDSMTKESEIQIVETPTDKGEAETATQITTSASGTEIQEENIKNALKEIINEIDQVVASESDFEKPRSSVEISKNEQFVPSSLPQYTFSPIITAPLDLPFPTTFSSSNSFQPQSPDSQYQSWCHTSEDTISNSNTNWSSTTPSSLPYFLTRPSRVVTPIPFAVPSEEIRPFSTTGMSSSSFKDETLLSREEKGMSVSSSGENSSKVDLEKIFTPSSDFDSNYVPRRKMYGSSSFYSETHPTVEEQVKLARKISESLTDSSNQKSKGQSMYVKRKKKSVKWIHEGPEGTFTGGDEESSLERNDSRSDTSQDVRKPLMKLVMNPSGTIKDWQSLKQSGMYNDHGALSPEICFDLVKDLHSPTGKGAQLFAKRRKRAEKWVVDETNVKRSDTLDTLGAFSTKPFSATPTTPNSQFMPPPSFIDRSRIQHAQKLNEIQERFSQPKLRLVKSPWEAALETGSVDTAFEDVQPPVTESLVAAASKLSQTSSSTWPENIVYKPAMARGYEAPSILTNYPSIGQVSEPVQNYTQTFPEPSKRFSMFDYGTNYNTAPRGFSHGQTVYKPVVFTNIQ